MMHLHKLYWLLLLSVLLEACPSYAGCFQLELTEFADSNETAEIVERAQFISLNGVGLPFDLVPSSLVMRPGSNLAESSKSKGCYSDRLLRNGSNTVQFQITNTDFGTYVNSQNIVSMDIPGSAPRQIFNIFRTGVGSNQVYQGTNFVQLSLSEIAPELARRIADYQGLSDRIRKQILNPEQDERLTKIKSQLDELSREDLDSLTPEQLVAVDNDSHRLGEDLKDLKKSIAGLTAEAEKEAASLKEAVTALNVKALKQLQQEGIESKDLDDKIAGLDLPTIEIPSIKSDAQPFDTQHDQYDAYSAELLRRLDSARLSERRVEFIEIALSWTRSQINLGGTLQQRSDLEPGEYTAFLASQKKVKKYLDQYVDEDLYFKDVNLPGDIKRGIEDDIAALSPRAAADLRDAINGSHNFLNGPSADIVPQILRALKIYAQMLKNMKDLVLKAKALAELNDRIRETTEYIRMEVSVIPVANSFVSFCEAVTAHQFCLPSGRELTTSEQVTAGIMAVLENKALSQAVARSAEGVVGLAKFARFGKRVEEISAKLAAMGEDAEKFREKLQKLSPSLTGFNSFKEVQIFRVSPRAEEIVDGVRSLKPKFDPWSLSPSNIEFTHRFTEPGIGGLYVSLEKETARIEFISTVKGQLNTQNYVISSAKVSLSVLLDISDAAVVRDVLGIDMKSLIQTNLPDGSEYLVTQLIGAVAKEHGYKGIISASARKAGGRNIVLFAEDTMSLFPNLPSFFEVL